MKLCIDCLHMGDRGSGGTVCRRTKMINSVTGEPFYRTCEQERADHWRTRLFGAWKCGSAGIHWEAKTRRDMVDDFATQFRWGTPPEMEGLPGASDYSYEEFGRDCDRHDR